MSTFKALPSILVLCLAGLSACAASAAERISVQFEGIADGDTIYVRDVEARSSLRVRLAMIDAPEKKQAYGMESKAALAQLLRGAGDLTLIVHGHDRYGRVIALVEDARGRDINTEMVAQGGAWVYKQYAKASEYSATYPAMLAAERQAQEKGLGLWGQPDPVAPWDYRRSNK